MTTYQPGDRVARFDGSVGTVYRTEPDEFSLTVFVRWDDPAIVDEFDGISDDNLVPEEEYSTETGVTPHLPNHPTHTSRMTLRIPDELRASLKTRAGERGETMTDVALRAFREYVA